VVLRFAHDSCAEGAGLAFFSKLIPSLHLLKTVLDVEYMALTPAVRGAVSGVKRELAKLNFFAIFGLEKPGSGSGFTKNARFGSGYC
jgi:hypothetical protein